VNLIQDSNDNGVGLVNFGTSNNLFVKSTMFPLLNTHKFTWTSSDDKTHSLIDHILIDRRWHLRILSVRSFRGTDCDTGHYIVVAEISERLAREFDVERFNPLNAELNPICKSQLAELFCGVFKFCA
jgi:hypothetical protein